MWPRPYRPPLCQERAEPGKIRTQHPAAPPAAAESPPQSCATPVWYPFASTVWRAVMGYMIARNDALPTPSLPLGRGSLLLLGTASELPDSPQQGRSCLLFTNIAPSPGARTCARRGPASRSRRPGSPPSAAAGRARRRAPSSPTATAPPGAPRPRPPAPSLPPGRGNAGLRTSRFADRLRPTASAPHTAPGPARRRLRRARPGAGPVAAPLPARSGRPTEEAGAPGGGGGAGGGGGGNGGGGGGGGEGGGLRCRGRPSGGPCVCTRAYFVVLPLVLPCFQVASHAVEGEVVDPGTSARSRHHVLACRSGAPAAEQPRINGMALRLMGKSSLAYPRGPCLYEHTWQHMDSCLACNTLQLLDFAIVSFRGGLVLLSLFVVSLANSVCVCLRTCFTILLSYLVFRLIAL